MKGQQDVSTQVLTTFAGTVGTFFSWAQHFEAWITLSTALLTMTYTVYSILEKRASIKKLRSETEISQVRLEEITDRINKEERRHLNKMKSLDSKDFNFNYGRRKDDKKPTDDDKSNGDV